MFLITLKDINTNSFKETSSSEIIFSKKETLDAVREAFPLSMKHPKYTGDKSAYRKMKLFEKELEERGIKKNSNLWKKEMIKKDY